MRAQPRPRVCVPFLALLLIAGPPAWLPPLVAQAPVITSAGDPSVRNDTIYRLAVDSADHPHEASVMLLDDGVVRYEADGTGAKTYRQVVQILTAGAVDDYAEQRFAYAPEHQRLTVNWIRVVRPDGTVVSEAPTQVQDADVPASLAAPVYTNTKVRRVSLSGVAPGTIVDWSYTIEELKPFLAGDFSASWSVHTGRLVRRSRYVLDLPATMKPNLREENLTFARQGRVVRGRRVLLWATQDVPVVRGEEFMADSNGVFTSIHVTGPVSWETIGRWYGGLARDRYTVDRTVRAAVTPLLGDARTGEDTLRALQRWVAQDIRYVSIALGLGGYQPRAPAEVVATGYGDCKDKATLFIALAKSLGYKAHPVLVNSRARVPRDLPSIGQFNHAIAAVERPTGRVYLDLTADLVPYGELPTSLQGQFALVVHPDGKSEQVTLPEAAPGDNLLETRIAGTLGADGYVTASLEERGRGSRQYSLRQLFLAPIDSSRRADVARSLATRIYPGADADSLQIFDGRDLAADARVAIRIVRGLAARPAGTGRTMILGLPFGSMQRMGDIATALEAKGPRRFPIDAAAVVGPIASAMELTLILPDGWRAALPRSVSVTGKWGSYSATYAQEGNRLRFTRRLEGARGVFGPDALPDLVAWFRSIAADDVPYLLLEPGPTH